MGSLYSRRVFVNRFNLAMSLLTMAFGLAFLFWILTTLFLAGFHAFSTDLFTQMTPPPGSKGGLLNAIVGSLLMAAAGTLIGRVNSGKPFSIGATTNALQIPATGTLFLGINDDHVPDNSGNYVVKVWEP